MKDRETVKEVLLNKFRKIILHKSDELKMYKYAYDKYNLQMGIFADYVSERKSLDEVSNIMFFMMLDSHEAIVNPNKNIVSKYFTEKEIEDFSKIKIENEKIQFPLVFNVVAISDDQWIGSIDTDQLILLNENQLINYNTETQRTMQHVIRNGNDYYCIKVNSNAVNSISKEMSSSTYIPSPITLNIPEGEEDFVYIPDKHQLIINSIKAFDIIDGYHRFLGINKCKTIDEEFNYHMELRITHFNVEKAQRFIYQEDQKTKMTKVDSDSYNMSSPGVIVSNKINENSLCNIKGYIGRNNSKINIAKMAELITFLWFPGSKKEDRKRIIEVSKELVDDFNIITEVNPEFLDMEYNNKTLTCVMVTFYYYKDKTDKTNMAKVIIETIKESDSINKRRFYQTRKITQSLYNDIIDIIKEADANV